MDVDARAGGTFLAAIAESRAHDSFSGVFHLCGRHDNGGVFSAHLRNAWPREIALGELSMDFHPDAFRACEDQPTDIGILQQFLAYRCSRAGDVIEDTH